MAYLMNDEQVRSYLKENGLVFTGGHYGLTGGGCSNGYVDIKEGLQLPRVASVLGEQIALRLPVAHLDVIIGPERGGIILSYVAVEYYTKITGREIRGLYAVKTGDGKSFAVQPGDVEKIKDKYVAIVEDVTTTGTSTASVIKAVLDAGAKAVDYIVTVCNRGKDITAEKLSVRYFQSLCTIELQTWENEAECELHQQGIPLDTKHGRGRKLALQSA